MMKLIQGIFKMQNFDSGNGQAQSQHHIQYYPSFSDVHVREYQMEDCSNYIHNSPNVQPEVPFQHFMENMYTEYKEEELSIENLLPSLTSSDLKSTQWTSFCDEQLQPVYTSANTFIDFSYLTSASS